MILDTPNRKEVTGINLNYLLECGVNFAFWKKPDDNNWFGVLSHKTTLGKVHDLQIEDLPFGYLAGAFPNKKREDAEYTFFPADCLLSGEIDHNFQLEATDVFGDTNLLLRNRDKHKQPKELVFQNLNFKLNSSENFIEQVQNAIDFIKEGYAEKIVCANQFEVDGVTTIPISEFFKFLCLKYPHQYIYTFCTPENGLYMGATPEKLVQTNDNGRYFSTVALAGTKRTNDTNGEVSWTEKEIQEQALVTRYIIECLKKIRLREYIEKGPFTIQAGPLSHLCSHFEVDTKMANFENLGSLMLKLLHPTSAVCGTPADVALGFINATEKFKRNFYAGFSGPVNQHGSTDLMVTLRCLNFKAGKLNIIAGAGITAGSNPEKEQTEIELKAATVLNPLVELLQLRQGRNS